VKVILALGNPGPEYTKTRHNTGFAVLDALAGNAKWRKESKFSSDITEVEFDGEKLILVKPTTFYNESGVPAQKIISFYKLSPSDDLLVIHDDLAIPFGTIRIREKGSDGGNNGIKSINSYIGENYKRIRIGTYNELREQMDDADFVLSRFSAEEVKRMNDLVIPKAIEMINKFVSNTLEVTTTN
jgi:peptidyl-tRNA hydrolase, PTH1 family